MTAPRSRGSLSLVFAIHNALHAFSFCAFFRLQFGEVLVRCTQHDACLVEFYPEWELLRRVLSRVHLKTWTDVSVFLWNVRLSFVSCIDAVFGFAMLEACFSKTALLPQKERTAWWPTVYLLALRFRSICYSCAEVHECVSGR